MSGNAGGAGDALGDGLHHDEPDEADYRLPVTLWEEGERDLAAVEPIVREVAAQRQLEQLGNTTGRFPWPSRGIKAKDSMSTMEVRISLQPNVMIDGQVNYVLERISTRAGSSLLRRRASYEALVKYLPSELAQGERIRRDLLAALDR